MASADFPPPLSGGISPGRCLFCPLAPLGSTECRQWLLGFVFASTLAPDILPHCPFVFLRSSVGLPPFRAGSLRRRPGGSATVGATSPRREPFIPQEQTPAGHTSCELAFAASIPVRGQGFGFRGSAANASLRPRTSPLRYLPARRGECLVAGGPLPRPAEGAISDEASIMNLGLHRSFGEPAASGRGERHRASRLPGACPASPITAPGRCPHGRAAGGENS